MSELGILPVKSRSSQSTEITIKKTNEVDWNAFKLHYKEGNINDLILKIFRNEYKKIIQRETIDRPTGRQT